MLAKIIFLTGLLLQNVVALPGVIGERQTACQSVHIFVARGSTEPYPGTQSKIIDAVCQGLSSCGYEDIGYAATFENYCNSAQGGVTNGTAVIKAYNARCPDSKLVLTGYSQGAHVIGDILGGGGGSMQNSCTQPTSAGLSNTTAPGNKIVAASLFGDVRHSASQSWNVGTGANRAGIWPRAGTQLSSLAKWASVLRSWCESADPVCANENDGGEHGRYFDKFGTEAGNWIKSKL